MVDREELHELAREMLADGARITDGSLVMMACEEIGRLREALDAIRILSGLDDALIVGADPLVFARMGDIHQHASSAIWH